MRTGYGRLGVTFLATTIVGGGWLLRAAPSVAQNVCQSRGSVDFPNEDFSRKGHVLCFTTTNPDGSQEVFVADLKKGGPVSVAKDGQKCRGGTKHGQACRSDDECPQGFCRTSFVTDCRADAKGNNVFFIFNGDPTGGNKDLSDELFRADKKRKLTQATNQGGWCATDPSKACTTSADCPKQADCARASMSGLHVAPDGSLVAFGSSGDPGGNAAHADAVFVLASGRKGSSVKLVSASARVCGPNTAKRDQPCTKDEDCGAVCGDGLVQSPEQCEPLGGGCSQGQTCGRPGSANQCACQPIVCGNGVVEGNEECDGTGTCDAGSTCGAPSQPGACTCVLDSKPTCGNGMLEGGEQCDPGSATTSGCPPFQTCGAKGSASECRCTSGTATCGNGKLERGEACDGAAFPCRAGSTCNASCQCTTTAFCGNGTVDPGEQCDGSGQAQCKTGFTCSGCRCV